MPTMTRTAEVKTRTTAQIKADAAAVYARWGISLSTQSTCSSRSRSKSEASPSTCDPRLPRSMVSSATPIAPRWTQTALHSRCETSKPPEDLSGQGGVERSLQTLP